MSVMIETSLGSIVVDLFCSEAPLACKNFLKLCKVKYYHGCLFYNVQPNFMIQTGDPSATGRGGTSVYGLLYGDQAKFFQDELHPTRKHTEKGLLSMANMGQPSTNTSQFYFTMRGDDLEHLDGKHTIFGKVEEGMEVLDSINAQFCDEQGRPFRDIRVLHTHVLDDPYPDQAELEVPPESPVRDKPIEERVVPRLGANESINPDDGLSAAELEKSLREREAKSHAVVLEMIGDLPDADMAPPENVLFVCKLNPVTTDDDLEIIFTQFGPCKAEICRDHITGDGLNYAFVEFETDAACEQAFKKMNNVLIDDRRIRVDFSQSVSKEWGKYRLRAAGGQKLKSAKSAKKVGPPASKPAPSSTNIANKPIVRTDVSNNNVQTSRLQDTSKNYKQDREHKAFEERGSHRNIEERGSSARKRGRSDSPSSSVRNRAEIAGDKHNMPRSAHTHAHKGESDVRREQDRYARKDSREKRRDYDGHREKRRSRSISNGRDVHRHTHKHTDTRTHVDERRYTRGDSRDRNGRNDDSYEKGHREDYEKGSKKESSRHTRYDSRDKDTHAKRRRHDSVSRSRSRGR